jgi:hypothetical protein
MNDGRSGGMNAEKIDVIYESQSPLHSRSLRMSQRQKSRRYWKRWKIL